MTPLLLICALATTASPPPDVVTAAPGDTLESIATRAYGSRHYADLVARVNHLARPEALRAGASVSVPPIASIAAPIAKRLPDGSAALLRAHASAATRS